MCINAYARFLPHSPYNAKERYLYFPQRQMLSLFTNLAPPSSSSASSVDRDKGVYYKYPVPIHRVGTKRSRAQKNAEFLFFLCFFSPSLVYPSHQLFDFPPKNARWAPLGVRLRKLLCKKKLGGLFVPTRRPLGAGARFWATRSKTLLGAFCVDSISMHYMQTSTFSFGTCIF